MRQPTLEFWLNYFKRAEGVLKAVKNVCESVMYMVVYYAPAHLKNGGRALSFTPFRCHSRLRTTRMYWMQNRSSQYDIPQSVSMDFIKWLESRLWLRRGSAELARYLQNHSRIGQSSRVRKDKSTNRSVTKRSGGSL